MDTDEPSEIVLEPLRLPRGPDGGPHGQLCLPRSGDRLRAVLVLHGFKGFAGWGFFPALTRRLAAAGIAAAGLDFSHNGTGEHPGVFDRLDRFEANSIDLEIREAGAAFAALGSHPRIDPARVGLLGHSRGGAVALLLAARLQDGSGPGATRQPEAAAVVGWAAVGDFRARFSPEDLRRYGEQGFLEVQNARTGQQMRIGRRLYQEIVDPEGRFDPARAAARLQAPVLLVHGEDDAAVPVSEAELIAGARPGLPTEVVRIAGTGHTFGAVHPFAGPTPALEQAIAATLGFLERRL